MNEIYQTADWKKEKHTPVIEVDNGDEEISVKVSVGKEIAHPNTTAHHIRWITLYFHPEGEKFPYEVGKVEFNAHGASVKGADSSDVYTHPASHFVLKTDKSGTLLATSFCNIHGLWRSSKEI